MASATVVGLVRRKEMVMAKALEVVAATARAPLVLVRREDSAAMGVVLEAAAVEEVVVGMTRVKATVLALVGEMVVETSAKVQLDMEAELAKAKALVKGLGMPAWVVVGGLG